MDLFYSLISYLQGPVFPWKSVLITMSLGKYVFESYITLRQYSVLQKPTPPAVLARDISHETFKKTQMYGLAKAKFSLFSGLWLTTIKCVILHFDILATLWHWSGSFLLAWAPQQLTGHTSHSVLFTIAYIVAEISTNLPLQLFQTFVLEEAFGFNTQTLRLFVTDQLKTILITSTLLVPTVSIFLSIVEGAGDRFALYLCSAAITIRVLIMTIYPVFILPWFYKLTVLESNGLKKEVQVLAENLNFPLTKLYLADGSSRSNHSNAFFFGFPWQKNIVVFDTLLSQMKTSEATAVIAHELGHWKLGHTTRLFGISQLDLLYSFGLFSIFIHNPALYSAFGFEEQPVVAGFILFCQALGPISAAHQFLLNNFTRKYEYEADHFARKLGYKSQLSTALLKLNVNNLSTVDADPVYSAYHHSHPLLAERLEALIR